MTYLEIVNKILVRLRENEVTTVSQNSYSKLIGSLVNSVKHDIEDAYDWSALRTTITANTTAGIYSYVLTDADIRTKIIDVINDTTNYHLTYQTTTWFDTAFLTSDPLIALPNYWNLNGVSADGFHQVDLYPIPDATYAIRFNVIRPQAELTLDSEALLIPYQLVVEGVLARAISERGEDGGYQEQEARFARMLSDYIAIESGNRPDESIWYPI